MAEKRGLGRGLSALMADVGIDRAKPATASEPARAAERTLPIEKIHANPTQPRKDFPKSELEELSASIKARGIIQPLVVRPSPTRVGEFEIVAGERRWRAAQLAQLHDLPVVVRSLTDEQLFELALIENLQRQDLNPYEEASAYSRLQEEYGHTQDVIAGIVGKSRSHVANTLRLLALPDSILDHLRAGALTAGHARAISGAPNREELAAQIIAQGLSVRQAEQLAQKSQPTSDAKKPKPEPKLDADTRALEGELSATLKMKVRIKPRADGGGQILLDYADLDSLETLLAAVGLDRNP